MKRINKQSFHMIFLYIGLCGAPMFCAPNQAIAQSSGGVPDNPAQSTRPPADSSTSPAARDVTWRSLPEDFLRDQKDIWTFPVQLAKGHHWLPTLASPV